MSGQAIALPRLLISSAVPSSLRNGWGAGGRMADTSTDGFMSPPDMSLLEKFEAGGNEL